MLWMMMAILEPAPIVGRKGWRYILTGKAYFINFFLFLKKESINV